MPVTLAKGEVILAVRPSLIRRGAAALAMLGMAALFARAGLDETVQSLIWRGCLMGLGLATLGLAWRFWQATSVGLELTADELRDSAGRRLFAVADVVRVDRGIFAMKPTNGLTVHLRNESAAVWQPGLWWRMGRRVGVGGVTAPWQARAIADTLSLLQADRESGSGI